MSKSNLASLVDQLQREIGISTIDMLEDFLEPGKVNGMVANKTFTILLEDITNKQHYQWYRDGLLKRVATPGYNPTPLETLVLELLLTK